MGAGFHRKTVVTQTLNAEMWKTYVVPRMIYGLEVLHATRTELNCLENFQTRCLHQVQHLPERAATVASLALMGIQPLTSVIHRSMLSLFYMIICN